MMLSREEAVVHYLKSIANHIEPKPSYYITVSGKSSNIQTTFTPPLIFPSSCHYEIACCGVETYYSFPNINEDNNKVRVKIGSETDWKLIEIPKGCYNIKAINTTLKRLIKKIGGKEKDFCLGANESTLQSILTLKNLSVDFTGENGSLRTVLGFKERQYGEGVHESENIVNILRVNTILIHCDVVKLSRRNGIASPLIYTFFPNVPPGYKIVDRPRNLIYLPLTLSVVSHLSCWLTDQDDKPLDLRGEELSITFHVRAC